VTLAYAMPGPSDQPNSGVFAGIVVGLVSSADGTCISAEGPTPINSQRDGSTCFAERVGDSGQCVRVSSYTPATNSLRHCGSQLSRLRLCLSPVVNDLTVKWPG
jgi:hypothetical protein